MTAVNQTRSNGQGSVTGFPHAEMKVRSRPNTAGSVTTESPKDVQC
jgi:hypothetical protein